MKRVLLALSAIALLFGLFTVSCRKDKGDLPKPPAGGSTCDTSKNTYCAKIKSIVDANCISSGCHNSGSANGDLTSYVGLKAKVDNGSMNMRVVVDQDMPSSGPLPQAQIDLIDAWIKAGAPKE